MTSEIASEKTNGISCIITSVISFVFSIIFIQVSQLHYFLSKAYFHTVQRRAWKLVVCATKKPDLKEGCTKQQYFCLCVCYGVICYGNNRFVFIIFSNSHVFTTFSWLNWHKEKMCWSSWFRRKEVVEHYLIDPSSSSNPFLL